MMVGNISKSFALTFPYLHSFITMAIEKDRKRLAAHLPFAINKKWTKLMLGDGTTVQCPGHLIHET